MMVSSVRGPVNAEGSVGEFPRSARIYTLTLIAAYSLALFMLPWGRLEIAAALGAIFAGAALIQPAPRVAGGVNIPNLALFLVTMLLWQPSEILAGIGGGSFLGLLILRRTRFWRAAVNGTLCALPAAGAAALRHLLVPAGTGRAVLLGEASLLTLSAFGLFSVALFAGYVMLGLRHPSPLRRLRTVVTHPGTQLVSIPFAVVLAAAAATLHSDPLKVVLTAACALALPLARGELAYYHQSQQMLEEVIESVTHVLDGIMPGLREHSERVAVLAVETGRQLGLSEHALETLGLAARLHDMGILTGRHTSGALGGDTPSGSHALTRVSDRVIGAIVTATHQSWVEREGHAPHRRSLVSLAASIVSAAELYDNARHGLRPFPRVISRESVDREMTNLAGTHLDPYVVPALLRAAARIGPNQGAIVS